MLLWQCPFRGSLMLKATIQEQFLYTRNTIKGLFHLPPLIRLAEVKDKSTQGRVIQKNSCHVVETRTRGKI